MSIGGIDVGDMRRAYAQHPALSRWHNTSLSVIGDYVEVNAALKANLDALAAENAKLKADLEELKPSDDKSDEGAVEPHYDPLGGVEEAVRAAREEVGDL